MSILSDLQFDKDGMLLAVGGFFLMIFTIFVVFDGNNLLPAFGFIFATAPLWLPVLMFVLFYNAWLDFVRLEFDQAQNGRVTLEIRIPEEIFKSPEAMEMVLVQMYQTAGPDNYVQTYWEGKHPPTFSLELVSRGGDVRFYINTPVKKFKSLIETQLYAQYPGIEVKELEIDYTAEVPWDPDNYAYMAFHAGLKKADAYPLKTYIEYGLMSMPKEEEKVDPISSVIEFLGSLGPGEHAWMQILIEANREVTFKEGSLKKEADWKKEARGEIKNIIQEAAKRNGVAAEDIGKNQNQFLTDAEKDTIKAIERSVGKVAFDTAIRLMYMGTSESFNPAERIGAMLTSWRSYDDSNRNGIAPKWRTDTDWPWWQDIGGKRTKKWKEIELERYKLREYIPHTTGAKTKVLTTEELATIFHIPGKVVTTPNLGRIPSKRSEAPANLPIG